ETLGRAGLVPHQGQLVLNERVADDSDPLHRAALPHCRVRPTLADSAGRQNHAEGRNPQGVADDHSACGRLRLSSTLQSCDPEGPAMPRAFLLVLDSVGIGGAPDGARFGETEADTLGHIAEACARGEADRAHLRSGPLRLPNLDRLGLGRAAEAVRGSRPPGLDYEGAPIALWGHAAEVSPGKDTPSGHWEIAGVPVPFECGYLPRSEPAFPPDLVAA